MNRLLFAPVILAALLLGACGEEIPDPLQKVETRLGGVDGAIGVIVTHYQNRAEKDGTHRWITDEGIVAFGECIATYVRENLNRYETLLVAYDFSRDQDVLKERQKNRLRDLFIRFRERNPVIAKEMAIYRTVALQKMHDEVVLAPCENYVKRHHPDLV